MKHQRFIKTLVQRWAASALACAAALSLSLAAIPASAAGGGPPPNPVLKAPAAPSTFRGQMQAFDEQMITVGRSNPGADRKWNISGTATASEQALSQANQTELDAVYQAVSNVPNWQQIPDVLGKAVGRGQSAHLRRAKGRFQPRAILMGQSCTEGPSTYQDPGLATVIALQDAAAVGHIALDILPDSDVYGVIAVGEGLVVTSPVSIERTIVQAVTVGLDIAALAVQNAEDLFQQCGNDAQGAELDTVKSELEGGITTITGNISTLQGDLDTSVTNIRGDITGLKSDLDTSVAAMEQTLGDISSKVDAVANKVTGVQTAIDTKVEVRQLHLSVLSLTNGNRLLVSVTDGGQPVATPSLVSIRTATDNGGGLSFSPVANAQASVAGPGLLLISLPGSTPSNTIFQIEVSDAASSVDNSGQTHYGTIIYE